jgi:hypothetical protein
LIVDRRERERYWRDQRDWRRPAFDSHFARTSTPVIRPWSPNPAYVRSSAHPQFRRSAPEIVRPAPIARETHRSLIADWNAPGAQDRAQRNRETPRRTSNGQGSMTPPPTNSFHSAIAPPPVPSFTPLPPMTPMAPAPLATPMPQPAQTPPTVYSRGNRVPSSDGQDSSRAPRNRSGPPRDRANVPAATRSAPAPSPQAAPAPPVAPVPATPPAPNTERTQPISRGGRPERTTPVASAPQAESSPSDVQGDARRGRSRGDRRD